MRHLIDPSDLSVQEVDELLNLADRIAKMCIRDRARAMQPGMSKVLTRLWRSAYAAAGGHS